MDSDHTILHRAFDGLADAAAGNPRALLLLAQQARQTGDTRRSHPQ